MDCCPHCGSTSAFTYNATLVTSRRGEWGQSVDEEIRVESSVFPKTVKCEDCGRRVNFDLAHGKAVEHGVHPTGGTRPGHAAPVVNGYCFDCGLPRPTSG